jgi:hypothetical protein
MTQAELKPYLAGESAYIAGIIREAERLARAERIERNRRRGN